MDRYAPSAHFRLYDVHGLISTLIALGIEPKNKWKERVGPFKLTLYKLVNQSRTCDGISFL